MSKVIIACNSWSGSPGWRVCSINYQGTLLFWGSCWNPKDPFLPSDWNTPAPSPFLLDFLLSSPLLLRGYPSPGAPLSNPRNPKPTLTLASPRPRWKRCREPAGWQPRGWWPEWAPLRLGYPLRPHWMLWPWPWGRRREVAGRSLGSGRSRGGAAAPPRFSLLSREGSGGSGVLATAPPATLTGQW